MLPAGMRALALAGLLIAAPTVAIERLQFAIADIRHPAFEADNLRIAYQPGAVRIDIARLAVGERSWRELRLECAGAKVDRQRLACADGRLYVQNRPLPLRFDLDYRIDSADATLRVRAGSENRIDAVLRAGKTLSGAVSGLSIAEALAWLPAATREQAAGLLALKPAGRIDGRFEWNAGASSGGSERLMVAGRLGDGAFSSADGLQAGEELGLEFRVEARGGGARWDWQAHANWARGAIFVDPFYVAAGSVLDAEGRLDGDRLQVRAARLALDGVEQITANGSFDLGARRLRSGALTIANADLALVGPRWLAPLLAPASVDRLVFSGRVSAGLRFADGRLAEADARFEQAGFALRDREGSRLAFGPVDGLLPWRADGRSEARLAIGGGRWEKLSLGPFVLQAAVEPQAISFARTEIALLDGAVVLEGLRLRQQADGWAGEGSVFVEPVSMPLLTAALDLPTMQGVLSASIPGLWVRPREIGLDGALVIQVFDGYLQATGLKVREPFGVAAHLSANIEGRRLDLAQITDTFSFGSISGLVDVDVRGLELLRWRPAAFEARVVSSPGRYPRRISQRAVQNISALGGAGAMAALQRGVLSFFDSFGYREVGFHCVLKGEVCNLSGIAGSERADGGFVLVRGGGIPALDVIGYNRRVDWPELVERLQRIIRDNVPPEVH